MKTESQPKLDALELARIRENLFGRAESYRESGDDMDACSWGMEYGVLISANDAQRISDAIHALFEFISNPVFAQAPAMYSAMQEFLADIGDEKFACQPEAMFTKHCNAFQSILSAARGEDVKPQP